MTKKIKVAVVQRSGAGSPKDNLSAMASLVESCVRDCRNLDVVVFPEYCYYAPTTMEESQKVAEEIPGFFTDSMAALARKYQVNIIPGTFIEKAGSGKVHNTSVFIDRKGEILATYRKVHLMDAIGYKESDYVERGNSLCVFDSDIGRVGMMVCYDLRFPEMARSMVLQGADVLFVPAEFPSGNPLPPRTDHWDILVRSTGLYNLTYVVAANQFGALHKDHPFGRSCIVDPWGTVIAAASGRQDVIYATLDMEYQREIRDKVATWVNRRPEVYAL